MDSLGWADLPAELTSIIFLRLRTPTDTTRFRSVCRSWRSSTSPPPNILSPFFPLHLSFSSPRYWTHYFRPTDPITLISTAVYLLRPRHLPNSTPWMVSVQESNIGKLTLRHALTHAHISAGDTSVDVDLSPSSESWIATQIARSYGHNESCTDSKKVAFVSSSDCYRKMSGSSSNQLIGLCLSESRPAYLFGFMLRSRGGKAIARNFWKGPLKIEDLVYFNGWIYAVDKAGYMFVFDDGESEFELVRVDHNYLWSSLKGVGTSHKRLVVSDGDLYLVLRCYRGVPDVCRMYRLVLMEEGSVMNPRCKWEEVGSLGDRVFFIRRDCSFSVLARDLPEPWKGNCVVFVDGDPCRCHPGRWGTWVCHLGGDQHRGLVPMSSFQGYSDLFAKPSSWT